MDFRSAADFANVKTKESMRHDPFYGVSNLQQILGHFHHHNQHQDSITIIISLDANIGAQLSSDCHTEH